MNRTFMRSQITFMLFVTLGAASTSAHPAPGIVVDARENVYFVDFTRDRILRVDPAGKLSVFADGGRDHTFSVPHHLSIDAAGNLYTAGDRDGKVVRIAPNGKITPIYPPPGWYGVNFIGSGGDPFAVDSAGNIYGINRRQFKFLQILRIDPDGRLEILAGGSIGAADGRGAAAGFGEPVAMTFACGPNGDLFVSDGARIRRVQPDGNVTTFAGASERGDRDGKGSTARFSGLAGISFDPRGNLWAADTAAGKIRRIAPDGTVTTLSGKFALPASRPSADAEQTHSGANRQRPLRPVGIAVGASGSVYVLDYPDGDDARVTQIGREGIITTIADLALQKPADETP